jgi:cobalamin synthase
MDWIGSAHGMCLTIGGLSAITAFLLGLLINKPRADKMGRIGKEIMQAGGKPTEAQIAEMTALRMGITSLTKVMAVLVLIAVLGMAAAKYVN